MSSTIASTDQLKQRITAFVDSHKDEILETSRHLYDHPELSGEEYESAKYLAGRAESHGFEVTRGVGGLPTAFKAVKKGGADHGSGKRPVIAFLAEYDALPVIGHGCGHNMIGTAGTYSAIALGSVAEELPFDVALFGTPAEETDGGKITMLNAGVFEGVSAALMMHPGTCTEVAYASLASICVRGEFIGKSAHAAASPWKGINALDAMIQLFINVDMARKQLPPTVRMPGIITKGGDRANMVPDHTICEFSLRGTDKEQAEMVVQKWIECAEAAAKSTGCKFTFEYTGNPFYDMRPDPKLAELFKIAWRELGGEEPITEVKSHGSLDIGNLSHRFPCLHPSVRITPDDTFGVHTPEFREATLTSFAADQLARVIKGLACTGCSASVT
jgi:amidohydrolase